MPDMTLQTTDGGNRLTADSEDSGEQGNDSGDAGVVGPDPVHAIDLLSAFLVHELETTFDVERLATPEVVRALLDHVDAIGKQLQRVVEAAVAASTLDDREFPELAVDMLTALHHARVRDLGEPTPS